MFSIACITSIDTCTVVPESQSASDILRRCGGFDSVLEMDECLWVVPFYRSIGNISSINNNNNKQQQQQLAIIVNVGGDGAVGATAGHVTLHSASSVVIVCVLTHHHQHQSRNVGLSIRGSLWFRSRLGMGWDGKQYVFSLYVAVSYSSNTHNTKNTGALVLWLTCHVMPYIKGLSTKFECDVTVVGSFR
mmetsp:Transcript_32082/g.35692  ORF Transcript_32082/g.35692 Transcript_32082/m.35692 type:complete len:190 (+) Transcript_32082:466-1035(+)